MQRRGDEALLGQTPEGIEAAAAGKLDGFGIAEGDVAGAVGVGGEEDLPVPSPAAAQKRLGGIRRLPVAAAVAPVLISKIFPARISRSIAARALGGTMG